LAKKKAVRVRTAAGEAVQHGGGDNFSDQRDAVQAAFLKHLGTSHSDAEVLTQAQSEARCGGLALPALSLRYLFHQEALPLGRTIIVAGQYRSNKTAMTYELSRMVLTYHGLGWYMSVEEKDSPDMRAAILGHDPTMLKYLMPVQCGTQQQWQGGVSIGVERVLDICKGKFTSPGVAIVDSVAAAKPKEAMEKFFKDKGGAGSRSHPDIALLNSDWMSYVTHFIGRAPFLLLPIQHTTEKAVEGMPGVTTKNHKGGGEFGFAKTMSLEMARIRDIKEGDNYGAVEIAITCSKNSLGPTNRKLNVKALWWWHPDPVHGRPRQEYVWDWHDATINLLLSFEKMDGRKSTWKKIREVCDLHVVAGRRVWSRALGIPESSPVSYTDAGIILEYDHRELLPGLYDVLHITRRPIMVLGGDLWDVWNGKIAIPDVPEALPYPRPLDRTSEFEQFAK
jgi:hypothetical protein